MASQVTPLWLLFTDEWVSESVFNVPPTAKVPQLRLNSPTPGYKESGLSTTP